MHDGEAVIAPSTTRRLLERFAHRLPDGDGEDAAQPDGAPLGPDHPRLVLLTQREREVLEAVGRGLTNTEIAATLFLAEATVKTHIGRVLHKLALRDRVQTVITAYETGLVGREG